MAASWIDSGGSEHQGFPPPGYWQATDGRWYPPQSNEPVWLDASGVQRQGPIPSGFWQATDGRWYPPQPDSRASFAQGQATSSPATGYTPTAAMASAADQPEGGDRRPFWRRRWFLIGAGVLVLIAVVGALSDPESEEASTSAGSSTTASQDGSNDVPTDADEDASTSEPSTSTTTTEAPTTTSTSTTAAPPDTWQSFTASGSGDDVITFAIPGDEPAVLTIEHSGSRNFAITSYTSLGDRVDLLVNEIGPYTGRVGVNFLQGEEVGELEISADGSWSVTAAPLLATPSMTSSYEGTGDDVILYGGSGGRLQASHSGESNFAVIAWGDFGRDLLVNEIGNYSGTVRLDGGTILLAITADGPWSLTTE